MERGTEYDPFAQKVSSPERDYTEQKSAAALFRDFYTDRMGGVPPEERDLDLLAFAGELAAHADTHADPEVREIERLLAYLLGQEENA